MPNQDEFQRIPPLPRPNPDLVVAAPAWDEVAFKADVDRALARNEPIFNAFDGYVEISLDARTREGDVEICAVNHPDQYVARAYGSIENSLKIAFYPKSWTQWYHNELGEDVHLARYWKCLRPKNLVGIGNAHYASPLPLP